jgi:hypothetical protein
VTGITSGIFGRSYVRGLGREGGRVEVHINGGADAVPPHGRVTMKRSSTFLLAALTAMGLAACNPPKSDTNTTGGTGSETGAMPADTATMAPGAATDTGMGARTDTAARTDSIAK